MVKSLVFDADFARKFEYFGESRLEQETVQDLAQALFRKGTESFSRKASKETVCGFIPLWRIYIGFDVKIENHVPWISRCIDEAFRLSLRFANEIFYFWSNKSTRKDEGKEEYVRAIRQHMEQSARDTYKGRPELLEQVIDPAFMYSSYHLIALFSEEEYGGEGLNLSRWTWLGHELLNAASFSHETVIPQLVCLLVNEKGDPIQGFSHEIREDFVNTLFHGETNKLMRIVSSEIDLEKFDQREIDRIVFAKRWAKKWRSQLKGNP